MARIRSIKPEFWTSEQVVECSTNARLLFIGLWNFCDDYGRHPFALKQIKALIFPADDFSGADVAEMLGQLIEKGLLVKYEVKGREYLLVTGWRHQKIDRRQEAKFPAPPSSGSDPLDDPPPSASRVVVDNSPKEPRALATDRNTEGTGEEKIETSPPSAFETAREKKEGGGESFDKFWSGYPRPDAAARTEARQLFEAFSEADRLAAIAGAAAYARAFAENPTSRSKSVAAFLRGRAFEGLLEVAAKAPALKFKVDRDSSAGTAWQAYGLATRGKGYAWSNGCWWFPAPLPPLLVPGAERSLGAG